MQPLWLCLTQTPERLFVMSRNSYRYGQGQLGLRQSDAVFQHTAALPQLIGQLGQKVDLNQNRCGWRVCPAASGGGLLYALLSDRSECSHCLFCGTGDSSGANHTPAGGTSRPPCLQRPVLLCLTRKFWFFMSRAAPRTCCIVMAPTRQPVWAPAVTCTPDRLLIVWVYGLDSHFPPGQRSAVWLHAAPKGFVPRQA